MFSVGSKLSAVEIATPSLFSNYNTSPVRGLSSPRLVSYCRRTRAFPAREYTQVYMK
jgi:hypothetical protein